MTVIVRVGTASGGSVDTCTRVADNTVTISRPKSTLKKNFVFPCAYAGSSSEEDAKAVEASLGELPEALILRGESSCLTFWGAPASGKTSTLVNHVLPFLLTKLFACQAPTYVTQQFISLGCFAVDPATEIVTDLAAPTPTTRPRMRQNTRTEQHYIEEQVFAHLSSVSEAIDVTNACSKRCSSTTTLSRSHVLWCIQLTQFHEDGSRLDGEIFILDLKGYNRDSAGASHASGKADKTAQGFMRVVDALARKKTHVPFRDCKLMRVTQPAYQGQSHCHFIVCVKPDSSCHDETVAILGNGAKFVEMCVGSPKARITNPTAEVERVQRMIQQLNSKLGTSYNSSIELELGLEASADEVQLRELLADMEYWQTMMKSEFEKQVHFAATQALLSDK